MIAMSEVRTLATGLDHPEGVALGPDGLIYAGGEAGQVYRVYPDTGSVELSTDTYGYTWLTCKHAPDDFVGPRMAVEIKLGRNMAEQVRIHVQAGVTANGLRDLHAE